ncbi:replication protein, partial [Kosakonia cowanii]
MNRTDAYAWPWNAPRPAIDPKTFGRERPEKSACDRVVELFRREAGRNERHRHTEKPLSPPGLKIENATERDAERDRRLALTAPDRQAARHDRDSATLTRLRALPGYLRDPLMARLRFFRREQAKAEKAGKKHRPASRYIHGRLTQILQRIDRTDSRFCTLRYQQAVARERLDELLILPQLSRGEVRTAATLTAGAFSGELDRLCALHGEDMTPADALNIYQRLGERALMLNVTPPAWGALRTDTDRCTAPDMEKLPGALLRLTCADWWYRRLWRLRRIWREEQSRAACLVSRKTSAYMSQDALTEFREQRRRMREFLKAHELVSEDGFTLSLEEAYYAGSSNPQHRRFEMMANMKGLELIAEARGDVPVFLTVTTPSRFHATTEDGHPNPKWDGSTIRDSSDYLVSVFFAAVRKKLSRAKLRWYGIRVAEPHHDGTVHWHMMVFARPEDREEIVNTVRDIAIREDREELGDDITPRFKSEIITADKGSPTGYIATYIGKNLDGGAVSGNDPKTGKPRADDESGLPMTESVERAVGWAGLHGVRQFQFFGIPSRQVWRELRRLATQMARNPKGPQCLPDPAMDAVLAAADAGCFASYIMKQGGVLVPRKNHVIRTAYDISDTPNDYGETPLQIYGIWSPAAGEDSRVCTHPDNWTLVRKAPEQPGASPSPGVDPDVQGGPAAPWTRGNNCPPEQKMSKDGAADTTQATPPPEPEGVPDTGISEYLKSLSPGNRKALLKRIRNEPVSRKEQTELRPGIVSQQGIAPDAKKGLSEDRHQVSVVRNALSGMGFDLPESAVVSLLRGAKLSDGKGAM